MNMRIMMNRLLEDGDGTVLAGAINGRKALARLVEQTGPQPDGPMLVFLDFDGVAVATASFLSQSVFPFRNTVRESPSNLYPVIANPSNLVIEELKILVDERKDVLMLCNLDKDGNPHQARLLGKLDPKQRLTFDLVQQRGGETGAADLKKEHHGSESAPVQTAWNNRLAALANLGLLIESSQGRSKMYRPLFAGA
jgi:hypothetical protein